MAIISTISLNVALAICSCRMSDEIERFAKEGDCNEYTSFTHYNFFYSYPAWGKTWPNGNICEYHEVNTQCHICKEMPDRNFAGIGTLYLLNNGIGEADILVNDGYINKGGRMIPLSKRVPNTPQLSRMILLCPNHVTEYFRWQQHGPKKPTVLQMELF